MSGALQIPEIADDASTTLPGHARLARQWRCRGWLECGCTNPCHCEYPVTELRVDAYRDVVAYLNSHGLAAAPMLPELRELWKRGGSDRILAASVMGGSA